MADSTPLTNGDVVALVRQTIASGGASSTASSSSSSSDAPVTPEDIRSQLNSLVNRVKSAGKKFERCSGTRAQKAAFIKRKLAAAKQNEREAAQALIDTYGDAAKCCACDKVFPTAARSYKIRVDNRESFDAVRSDGFDEETEVRTIALFCGCEMCHACALNHLTRTDENAIAFGCPNCKKTTSVAVSHNVTAPSYSVITDDGAKMSRCGLKIRVGENSKTGYGRWRLDLSSGSTGVGLTSRKFGPAGYNIDTDTAVEKTAARLLVELSSLL